MDSKRGSLIEVLVYEELKDLPCVPEFLIGKVFQEVRERIIGLHPLSVAACKALEDKILGKEKNNPSYDLEIAFRTRVPDIPDLLQSESLSIHINPKKGKAYFYKRRRRNITEPYNFRVYHERYNLEPEIRKLTQRIIRHRNLDDINRALKLLPRIKWYSTYEPERLMDYFLEHVIYFYSYLQHHYQKYQESLKKGTTSKQQELPFQTSEGWIICDS